MSVPVFWHADSLLHRNPDGHPERPERATAVHEAVDALARRGSVTPLEPRTATDEELLRVHAPEYLNQIEATVDREYTALDADTSANRHTAEVARLGAGSAVQAVRAVSGNVRPFVAMRPPGHHALPGRAMGFCIYNTVAVAAGEARAEGYERVAIVDWDVHHGNGTEHIFRGRSDVFYASVHQSPHYPGTGPAHYTGEGEGEGSTLNCPLPAGCGRDEYLAVLNQRIVPAIEQFSPQLLLVSAGFDVHERDPLGGMKLRGEDFTEITDRLVRLAERHCDGRIVHILEGGYDLHGLAEGVTAVLLRLAE